MKNIFRFLLFICLSFLLFNCSKKKDYVEMIPADADFVIQINPKKIAEKANFNQIEKYQLANFAINEINHTDPSLKKLLENIQNSPTSSGVDIISPIYIFGKKYNNKIIATLAMKMNNKNDFEDQLKIVYKSIYQQDIDFVDENNYTFIKNSKKPFIAWNKQHFFFIAGEYGTSTKVLNQYFNELIKNESPLKSNNSFADFLSKTEDINIWYTGKFLSYLTKKQSKNENGLDFTKSSWATYLLFNKDNINFTQKFHPDPVTKVKLERRPMWKSKINTDFYKYFPARSYANFSFAVYPNNTRYIFDNQNFITEFLKDYEIDINTLENSAEGEVLFSIFDFEQGKSFNVNDYFGKKEAFSKNIIIPQFILGARMKNKAFYDELITKFGNSIVNEGLYKTLKIGNNQSIFLTYKYNILYITNNHIQMNNFILNRVDKFNFIQSEFSNRAKNSMFAYANLNIEDYPISVKNYFLNTIPFGTNPEFEKFINHFSKFQYNVTDEYTKNGSITLKKNDEHSLEIILKFLDKTYSLFTNPTTNTDE